jgi:hypothetical protein
MTDFEKCRCSCHTHGGSHVMACCWDCRECGKRIAASVGELCRKCKKKQEAARAE